MRTLFVVETHYLQNALQHCLERDGLRHIHYVTHPGAALVGHQFDRIVCLGFKPISTKEVEWFESSVLTCLKPGGELLT